MRERVIKFVKHVYKLSKIGVGFVTVLMLLSVMIWLGVSASPEQPEPITEDRFVAVESADDMYFVTFEISYQPDTDTTQEQDEAIDKMNRAEVCANRQITDHFKQGGNLSQHVESCESEELTITIKSVNRQLLTE